MNPKITIDNKARTVTIVLPLEPEGTKTKNQQALLIASTHGTARIPDSSGGILKLGVNLTK